MAQLDIFEFLLRHGFRQEILGCHPVWLGPRTVSSLMNNFPFNPSLRDLRVRCRSRLYPERYWLRHSTDLLCIGVSGLNCFPGSGSAGLGLFADCSANLDIPMQDINPHAEVFAEGDIICCVSRPCLSRLDYNDHCGYWLNAYMCWSGNGTKAYVGSSMRDYISYANDDLHARWNSRVEFTADPRDGKMKWLLVATRSIYTGNEITWSYGWEYWSHHSVGEMQLFAWRLYARLGDDDALKVDTYDMFDWVVKRNPMFDFQAYVDLDIYQASSVAPSTWRP